MSFTVNLRIEITKADSRATRVWLFYKRLVLHLVKGLMKEMQNNTTKPNNRRAQTNVFSARDGESSGFCTWSRVYALSSQAFGKQTVNRQGQPALGRSVCCAHCTGCFVSRLVSCCSSGSPKGPRQPVELSEPRELMSFWSGSCQPFITALDRDVWGRCAQCTSVTPVGPRAWLRPGALGLLVLKWRENPCFLSDGDCVSLLRESQLVDQNSSPPPSTPVHGVWPFSSRLGPRVVHSSLWSQITEEQ